MLHRQRHMVRPSPEVHGLEIDHFNALFLDQDQDGFKVRPIMLSPLDVFSVAITATGWESARAVLVDVYHHSGN